MNQNWNFQEDWGGGREGIPPKKKHVRGMYMFWNNTLFQQFFQGICKKLIIRAIDFVNFKQIAGDSDRGMYLEFHHSLSTLTARRSLTIKLCFRSAMVLVCSLIWAFRLPRSSCYRKQIALFFFPFIFLPCTEIITIIS